MTFFKEYSKQVIVFILSTNHDYKNLSELFKIIDYKKYLYSIIGDKGSVEFELNYQGTKLEVRFLIGAYHDKLSDNVFDEVQESLVNLISLLNYEIYIEKVMQY